MKAWPTCHTGLVHLAPGVMPLHFLSSFCRTIETCLTSFPVRTSPVSRSVLPANAQVVKMHQTTQSPLPAIDQAFLPGSVYPKSRLCTAPFWCTLYKSTERCIHQLSLCSLSQKFASHSIQSFVSSRSQSKAKIRSSSGEKVAGLQKPLQVWSFMSMLTLSI